MLIDPKGLAQNLERIEEIEKVSLRLVVQAIYDYREIAYDIFRLERDDVSDMAEDATREALDRLGMSIIDQRIFGKVDYKRARYVFHPDYAVKQALFIDSKAEKTSGRGTATLQTSQFSMIVRQFRGGETLEVVGELPYIVQLRNENYLTTTIFVKYNYEEKDKVANLRSVIVAAVPNRLLQDKYNPNAQDTIWIAGRNAPSLGEAFRVRLSFHRLRKKARWRVQEIPVSSGDFDWQD